MSNLKQTVADAKRAVRRNKKECPWIFPQYQEMETARFEFEAAKKRYEETKKVWRELGK